MPNFISNIGLASEGYDAAEGRKQSLARGQQGLEAGQIGLDDLKQQQAVTKATRTAGADAFAAGKTMGGSYLDMSNAAARMGDMKTAMEFRTVQQQLEDLGVKNVVHAALVDPTPGDRPDIAGLFRQNQQTQDVTGATLDEKGNLTLVRQGKPPSTLNVGSLAERLGMVKPFEHVLPPGSTYLRSNPINGQTTQFTAPPAEKYAATRTGTIFDQANGKVVYEPPDDSWQLGEIPVGDKKIPVSFSRKTGQAVVLGEGGRTQNAAVHTDNAGNTLVTIGDQVFKVNPGTPGTPEQKNLIFPNVPGTPGTPPSLQPVAPTEAPPAPPPGVTAKPEKAPNGKWYVPDPKRQGKFLEAAAPGAAPAAAPPPAAPSQPVARPAAAAAPAPSPVQPAGPSLADIAANPKLAQTSPGQRAARDAERTQATKVKRAELDKQIPSAKTPQQRMRLFQLYSDVMTPDERKKFAGGRGGVSEDGLV